MTNNYCLSLIGASVYPNVVPKLAQAYLEYNDWDYVKNEIVNENLLQINAESSRIRIGHELIKRLKTLCDDELEILACTSGDDRYTLEWASICRSYPFVRKLSEELVKGRFERMLPDVNKNVYEAFLEEESYEHEELKKLTDNTLIKLRSCIFTMLRECHLIDEGGRITPLYPTVTTLNALKRCNPEDLKLFPGIGVDD